MSDLAAYVDVESALVALVSDLATAAKATPADLSTQLPFIRIQRFSGPDDGITDFATVSVDAFATSRADALALAESVRQRILSTPHVTTVGLLDRARTLVGPAEAPWSDTQAFRRFTATYQVMARR